MMKETVVKGKNASEVSSLQIAWLTMDEKRLEMSEGEETAAVGTRSGGGSLKSRVLKSLYSLVSGFEYFIHGTTLTSIG